MLAPAPTTTTALSVRNLTVNYGTGVILDELDVKIPRGSFAGIVGANGSGKSTLLQACLGLLPKATRGQAQVEFLASRCVPSGQILAICRKASRWTGIFRPLSWTWP